MLHRGARRKYSREKVCSFSARRLILLCTISNIKNVFRLVPSLRKWDQLLLTRVMFILIYIFFMFRDFCNAWPVRYRPSWALNTHVVYWYWILLDPFVQTLQRYWATEFILPGTNVFIVLYYIVEETPMRCIFLVSFYLPCYPCVCKVHHTSPLRCLGLHCVMRSIVSI